MYCANSSNIFSLIQLRCKKAVLWGRLAQHGFTLENDIAAPAVPAFQIELRLDARPEYRQPRPRAAAPGRILGQPLPHLFDHLPQPRELLELILIGLRLTVAPLQHHQQQGMRLYSVIGWANDFRGGKSDEQLHAAFSVQS